MPTVETPAAQNVLARRRVLRGLLVCLLLALGLFYLRTYERVYDPVNGWSKLIYFGASLAPHSLPQLQRIAHATLEPGSAGYDGQFYAQMALDPTLRDPAFDEALDSPTYRARRIGLPALAFAAGLGEPRSIVQAYALANLFCWFALAAVLSRLFRPTTGRSLLCLGAALVGVGIIASMERALTDLPATTVIFGSLLLGSWGGCAGLAAAVLTRETSLLAAFGVFDPRQAWRGTWKGQTARLALAAVPLALWLWYVHHRFGRVAETVGVGNFDLPLRSIFDRIARTFSTVSGPGNDAVPSRLQASRNFNDLVVIATLLFQGLYLSLRREFSSPFWRIGMLYWALCLVLGPAVWVDTAAAARTVLPMTVGFYLQLSRERVGWWFWPAFLLGGLSIPHVARHFWRLT